MADRPVFLESLGCSKTLVDSEATLGMMLGRGWRLEEDPHEAELLLVNTCSFIESAREQSIERILAMALVKVETGARLVVIGCLPQRYADDLRTGIPEIDLLAGVGQQSDLVPAIDALFAGEGGGEAALTPAAPRISFAGFQSRPLLTPPHLAYLKIGEGCSRACSFCAIPGIRGRFRSRPEEELEAEARDLAERGVREINVISQDTGHYGRDLGGAALFSLIERLSRIESLRWIRLFYLHPALVDLGQLLELFSLPRVVPYLDMPIQHASNAMLKLMNRNHERRRLEDLLTGLRRERPDLCLRTTVLVGHPGETEADIEELLGFLEDHPFDKLGVFPYSEEEGTPSPGLGERVPPELVSERVERLQVAQMAHSEALGRAQIGVRHGAFVEALAGRGDGLPPSLSIDPLPTAPFPGVRAALRGSRDAYEVDGHLYLMEEDGLELGQWVEAEVIEADVYDLLGRLA
jgi:ribosomal protein S12 methylthiotransferase